MCNRYRLSATEADLAAALGVELDDVSLPPDELFPKRPALVVRSEGSCRCPEVMRWGFPGPAGAKAPVTNVRNLESSFWRGVLGQAAQRCLVPATEFCEWEGEPGHKLARWFSVPSRSIFNFAGVWRETAEGRVFAILTCEPNALVAAVHPKAMPVILHAEDEGAWLGDDWAEVRALAGPYPSQLMARH